MSGLLYSTQKAVIFSVFTASEPMPCRAKKEFEIFGMNKVFSEAQINVSVTVNKIEKWIAIASFLPPIEASSLTAR